ncbi:hypothetical protein A134_16290 [Vibrio crassostreae 9CS106]|nr:hypothetical protein A134_16290 [Vibrio crassostreae 9CS106]
MTSNSRCIGRCAVALLIDGGHFALKMFCEKQRFLQMIFVINAIKLMSDWIKLREIACEQNLMI